MNSTEKSLHWEQRIALIRHNLHAASRSGDFTFFKIIQANSFLRGGDHVGALRITLGDDADTLLAVLDNLNAGIAYIHEDAFKNVYNDVKKSMADCCNGMRDRQAMLNVDATQQKQMAALAIDKMISSASLLIQQQPISAREEAANVFIIGTTFIADALQIVLFEIENIQKHTDDFIRLENSWSNVQSSIMQAVSAIKGILNLMESDPPSPASSLTKQSRARSVDFTSWGNAFRRMSTALSSSSSPPSSVAPSRKTSLAGLPLPSAESFSNNVPTKLPSGVNKRNSGHMKHMSPIIDMPSGNISPSLSNPFEESFSPAGKYSSNQSALQTNNETTDLSSAVSEDTNSKLRRLSYALPDTEQSDDRSLKTKSPTSTKCMTGECPASIITSDEYSPLVGRRRNSNVIGQVPEIETFFK